MPSNQQDNSSTKKSILNKVWQAIAGSDREVASARADLQTLEERVLYDASPLAALATENVIESVELQLDELCELCFEETSGVDFLSLIHI